MGAKANGSISCEDMEGLSLTVIADVGEETQPEILLVKVNVAEPAAIPVITPELV